MATPRAGRRLGVVVEPRNAVMSANAVAGTRSGMSSAAASWESLGLRMAASYVIIDADGLPADRRTGDPPPRRPRIRRGGDRSPRHGMGRDAALPDGAAAEAGGARADGDPVRRGVRRIGDVIGGLLHLYRRAGARLPRDRALDRRAQRPVQLAHQHVRQRGAEAAVPAAPDRR